MRQKALRRAVGAVVVLSFAALLLSVGPLGDTLALFNGETQNAGTFAGGWVGAATAPTATASGYDVALAWTPGTHGPVTGQQLFGVDNTTNSNCAGAAYASLATMASATTAAYTDANRGNAGNDGDWFCYELVSTSATVWTAQSPLPALQLGLVANGISMTNVGTAGMINANDKITITFNQQTNLGSSNIKVCVWSSGSIVIGDTALTCLSSADAYSVGKLTISGGTIASNVAFLSSTVSLSTSAPWTMTITLAGSVTTSAVSGSPTWTLTPAATIKSSITTHQATICSSASTNCRPASTSNF